MFPVSNGLLVFLTSVSAWWNRPKYAAKHKHTRPSVSDECDSDESFSESLRCALKKASSPNEIHTSVTSVRRLKRNEPFGFCLQNWGKICMASIAQACVSDSFAQRRIRKCKAEQKWQQWLFCERQKRTWKAIYHTAYRAFPNKMQFINLACLLLLTGKT